jgi:hypothetical protein
MSSVSYKKILISTVIIIIPIILISIFILTMPHQLQEQERQSTNEQEEERSNQISTFGTREILSADNDNNDNSSFPLITASDNNVYVVWLDKGGIGQSDVSLLASSDSRTKKLSNNTGEAEFPQIAAAGNNVYAVWQDNATGNSDIYLKVGRDNGSKFRGLRNLSNGMGDSEFPQIATAGENMYVVWQDDRTGNSDIYLKAGRDGGTKFRGLRNLSNNTGESEFPQIAAAGDNLFVVWQDNTTGNSDIYLKAGRDNGTKISGTKNLSNNTGESEFPQIAAAGDNLFVVWQDNATGNSDIYLKAGMDGGTKFRGLRNLSNNTGESEFPQVAASGDYVYVVWQDDTTGDSEIHLKRIRISR